MHRVVSWAAAMVLGACAPPTRGGEGPRATGSASAPPVEVTAANGAPAPDPGAVGPSPSLTSSTPAPEPGPPVVCRRDVNPAPPPAPRRPRVKLGPQVTNHIPVEIVQRVVRARFACFRRCYQEGLARDPTLAGRVAVHFVIEDGTGISRSPRDQGSDLEDKAVVACVVNEFEDLRFPPPAGGDITVVYPIVFTPAP